jgi:hypothetical protein
MKTLSWRRHHYAAVIGILSIFLIMVALVAGMVGCFRVGGLFEIRDWYDLDYIKNNLYGTYLLMNDLDSTTAGYTELASPTANGGQGWQPIGMKEASFRGLFNGQGHEIRDLFINRPDQEGVGLFDELGITGRIMSIGVVKANVTGFSLVGGLVGVNWGNVSGCYVTGNVSSTGTSGVGGLVGDNVFNVNNCYSTASVSGNEQVGGLVGRNGDTVSNSYSTSSVTGNSYVGGLVGSNEGNVTGSYATGSVSGNEQVGGLVGDSDGTVSNSFWDTQTSGQTTSAGGTGENTTQMMNIATFSGAGWNIIAVANLSTRNLSYIWNIVTGVTYPFLSWQA